MHPSCLQVVFLLKDCIDNGKLALSAEYELEAPVVITATNAAPTKDSSTGYQGLLYRLPMPHLPRTPLQATNAAPTKDCSTGYQCRTYQGLIYRLPRTPLQTTKDFSTGYQVHSTVVLKSPRIRTLSFTGMLLKCLTTSQ